MREPQGGRPPPALKHGLTSRLAREEGSAQVEEMAAALLSCGHREPRLLDAARDAAEAILYLRRVRDVRRALLEGHARNPVFQAPEGGLLIPQLPPERFEGEEDAADLYLAWKISIALEPLSDGTRDEAREGEVALTGALANRQKELRRLDDYERRALSRRQKAIRRLDCERIEAERRGANAQPGIGSGPG